MNAQERAVEYFNGGFYCAESVLKSLSEVLFPGKGIEPSIATGFCSGLARTGGLCGALSGAILAVNAKYGRNQGGEDTEPVYERVRAILQGFQAEFGSTQCSELLGCHLGTDEGQAFFKEKNLKESRCFNFVREAVILGIASLEEA